MTDQVSLNLCLRLPFERAGLEFNIEINESDDPGTGPGFSLLAQACGSSERLAFQSQVSPVLADWVRGYTRWLYRARISAEHSDDAIVGSFAPGVTAEQVLEGLQLACDMIRQRFELYDESILDN